MLFNVNTPVCKLSSEHTKYRVLKSP